jgi:hypothetical protein
MTEKRKNVNAQILIFVGGLLILFNVLLVGIANRPIIISNFAADSPTVAVNQTGPLWGRIAFGNSDYASGLWPVVGVIIAALLMYSALLLYFRPRNETTLSITAMILSALSLLYGGGFIIGAILAFVGGASAYEKRKEFSQSFIGRILSAARIDSKFLESLLDKASIREGAMVVLFVNFLSGVGNALYTFNVEKVLAAPSTKIPFDVLLAGRMYYDFSMVATPLILMGLGLVKWVILSLILFVVGVKLFREESSMTSIAALTGLAYAPVCLQLFTAFVFTNVPYLTQWALVVFAVTNLWMILILTFGMRRIMAIPLSRAAGIVMLAGGFYFLINYVIFMPLSIPYVIRFQIQPEETLLAIASFFIALSAFFIPKKTG